jgi:hypothetical protein
MDPRLVDKLGRMYPSCTHKELMELAASIEDGKYWRARDGFMFAVALTRARSWRGSSWRAEVAGFGPIRVPEELQPFCRKGRVALVKEGEAPLAVLFLGWPAFLWAMRKGEVPKLVEGATRGPLRGYVNVPRLKEYLRYSEDEGLAGPSGIGPETPGSP